MEPQLSRVFVRLGRVLAFLPRSWPRKTRIRKGKSVRRVIGVLIGYVALGFSFTFLFSFWAD